jgi:hypothetical protein
MCPPFVLVFTPCARQIPPHPTQYANFDLSGLRKAEEDGVRIVRLFVELYIDAFGVFQKRAYSPEGVYITFGNMSRRERNKLSNIWCVGMKPPHTDTTVCLSVFTADVKKLQRGFYHTVKGEIVYVIGGLGIVKAGLLRVPSTSVFARPDSSWGICPANETLSACLFVSLHVRYATSARVGRVQAPKRHRAVPHVPREERRRTGRPHV